MRLQLLNTLQINFLIEIVFVNLISLPRFQDFGGQIESASFNETSWVLTEESGLVKPVNLVLN